MLILKCHQKQRRISSIQQGFVAENSWLTTGSVDASFGAYRYVSPETAACPIKGLPTTRKTAARPAFSGALVAQARQLHAVAMLRDHLLG